MRDDKDRADAEKRSPRTATEQDYPEPERPLNTAEERGQSIQELEHPPQAEGDRDDVEDSLRRAGENQ